MPFTPIKTLNCEADVKIFFSGLLLLKPSENDSCEVFVHSSASRHYVTIEVRRKQKERPDEVMMRHIGPLSFVQADDSDETPIIHGMVIRKSSEDHAVENSVKRFAPEEPQPEGAPDGLGFAIDFARPDFHDLSQPAHARFLDIDPLAARPSILLTDGTLYTAAKTRPKPTIKLKDANGGDIRELPPFASLIGANISLEDGSFVTISWTQQGKQQTLNLIKKADTRYEIYIINDPLFEDDSDPSEDNPKHDEFKEYYKVLQVPSDRQFRLEVELPEPGADRGSTRAPCMSVVINGGG